MDDGLKRDLNGSLKREPAFRRLPSVDRLIRNPLLVEGDWPHAVMVDTIREALTAARTRIAAGNSVPDEAILVADVLARLQPRLTPSLRRMVNATGVILHTNLGRAPVSDAAAQAMADVAGSYSNLEFDLESGGRGSRHDHLRRLLQEVTGAEDGIAVNNNAGALLLALSALANGRQVVVSRGQAVEIGGGFRIPDVMRQSGADLVEVGTTNRTYVSDYQDAVTPQTALFLRVHPSNFRISGFVHSVGIAELTDLAHRVGVGVLDDVGSGAILDPRRFGLGEEPVVGDSVQAGATVVCFSGDKLLGGPQAGILVGKGAAIDQIRRHPLARALRIDKACLAALEITLRHYQRGEATTHIPVWRMISTNVSELEGRARSLAATVAHPRLQANSTRAAIGGGSLPEETLPSWGLVLGMEGAKDGQSAETLARRLRQRATPIIARIERDTVLLDLRTVLPSDDAEVLAAIKDLLN